jgi:hypothetical protein
MIKNASISPRIKEAFLASCRRCFPEDRPIKDVPLSSIVNSELIDHLFSDAAQNGRNEARHMYDNAQKSFDCRETHSFTSSHISNDVAQK